MTVDIVYQIALLLFGGGCVYGGIRADIKNIHENLKTIDQRITKLEK